MKVKNYDNSIGTLRLFAIVLIVLHHSISLWFKDNAFQYNYCSNFVSLFMSFLSGQAKNIGLAIFTFISGYLFFGKSYNNLYDISKVLLIKAKRLLIPYVCWILLYFCFEENPVRTLVTNHFLNIFTYTHLWYLPALFFIMSICLFIEILPKNKFHFLFISVLLLSFLGFDFLGQHSLYKYFLIFMSGGGYKHLQKFSLCKNIWMWLFLSLVVYLIIITGVKNEFMFLLYSIVVAPLFLNIFRLKLFDAFIRNPKIQSLSRDSFGVYLIHQFIIFILVDLFHIHTRIIGEIAVPIVFIISFILSIILTKLLRIRKETALLIGE